MKRTYFIRLMVLDDNDGKLTKESNKKNWYFKLGGSYFTQATATEFPTVSGQPNRDIYVGGKFFKRVLLVLFGEGFVMVETLDTALQIV
jgi:hypothetical protein